LHTDPTSDDEFQAALGRLVTAAAENDVAVEGGWSVVTDGGRRLGVEVYRVESPR
jgi:hypothetical protein